MTFAQVLQPAIDMAENGFPIGERMAEAIAGSRKLKKYPTSVKVYFPDGAAPKPGDIFRNPDLARTLRKLVDAEKEAAGKGRHEALIKRGHKLRVGGPWMMGSLAAIVVDPKTGVLSAGTDPRVDAYAIAW